MLFFVLFKNMICFHVSSTCHFVERFMGPLMLIHTFSKDIRKIIRFGFFRRTKVYFWLIRTNFVLSKTIVFPVKRVIDCFSY